MGTDLPAHDGTGRRGHALLWALVALLVLGISFFLLAGRLWTPEIQRYVERRDVRWDHAVVFMGSRMIERFPLAEVYPGKECINFGAAEEDTHELRERLKATEDRWPPKGAAPRGIVLYVGSLDHRMDPALPVSEIVRRVDGVVDDLRQRFRKRGLARMLLLEILPERRQSVEERDALRALNDGLADLAKKADDVTFIRTHRPPLIDAKGDLAESMTIDRHHLNLDGYRVLARWIVEDGGEIGALLR